MLKQSGSSQIPQRAVSTASCFRASHTGDIQEGHSGQREYSSAEPTLIADSCVDSGRCTSQYPARSRSRQHVDATWPPLRHWHVGQQSGKEQHSNLCTTSHGPLIHKGRQHEQTAGTSHTMSCSPRVTSTSARAHELHTEHARVHWQPLPSLHGSFRHLSQQGHGYLDLPSQHISIQQPHLSQHRHYASYMPVKRQFKLPAHIEPLVRLKLEGAPKPPAPTIPPLEPRPMLATSRRTGVIAVKAGMTQEWDEYGARVPLTVLWVDDCQVRQPLFAHVR